MFKNSPILPNRSFPITLVGCAAALCLSFSVGCQSGHSRGTARVTTAELQRAMSPAQAVEDLKAGNARFVNRRGTRFDYLKQASRTASGQFPKAVVLSCLDSRVPPEVIFDQGIGDIFVGRIAGNFENTDLLGSMEFATQVAGAKAIVVLGHSECGAVKGAVDNAELGNLTATLANIKPAVIAARERMPAEDHSAANKRFVQETAIQNVRLTKQRILERSPVLAERARRGDLLIVGGMYDLATGQVEWID
jgi:carbonic anhydrase